MPEVNNNVTPITAELTQSEWEAVQLMRTRAKTDAELIPVPEAAYKLAETCVLRLDTLQTEAGEIREILDYLVGQMRTAA